MIRKQQIHRNTAILHIPLIPSLQVLPCTHSRRESERERESPEPGDGFFLLPLCSACQHFLWLSKIYVVCIIAVECISLCLSFVRRRLRFESSPAPNQTVCTIRAYIEPTTRIQLDFQLFNRKFKINLFRPVYKTGGYSVADSCTWELPILSIFNIFPPDSFDFKFRIGWFRLTSVFWCKKIWFHILQNVKDTNYELPNEWMQIYIMACPSSKCYHEKSLPQKIAWRIETAKLTLQLKNCTETHFPISILYYAIRALLMCD